MKLSKKATQALQLLESWENKNSVFNFEKIFGVAYFRTPRVEDCCYLMELEESFKATINKQFSLMAETGEGGSYALWNYPELEGEPPVIYFESDGNFEMVAPSLEAFAVMFSLDEFIEEQYIDYEDIYEYYELKDEQEAEKLFKKELKTYKKKVTSLFEIKSLEEYRAEMNRHKNFKEWYDYILEHGKDTAGEIGGNFHNKTAPLLSKTVNEINLSDFIEIVGLPITDRRVVDTIENIGVKIPKNIYKAKYPEITDYEEILDLKIRFEPIWNKKEQKEELFFDFISTWKVCKCIYPFNINRGDSYQQICEKIGKSAKYYDRYDEDSRIWELVNQDNKTFVVGVDFEDSSLESMNTMMIADFSKGNVNNMYEELE